MLTGRIIDIPIQKENGWGKYRIDNTGKETTAIGILPNAKVGMKVELDGSEEVNSYGIQFKITKVISLKRDENAWVQAFCENYLKGVGPSLAAKIAVMFGKDFFDILMDDTETSLLLSVPRVNEKTIKTMRK